MGFAARFLRDGADHRHGGGGGRINHAGHVVVGEVVPDALGAVHRVKEAAGLAGLAAIFPGGGVNSRPVGTNQALFIDLAHPVQRFLVFGGLVDRHKLAVLLHPFVAAAEPGLDHVQRAGVFAKLKAVGIVNAVAVGIVVGEGVEHVVNVFNRLRRLGDADSLRPVGAVGQAVPADRTGARQADDLAVDGQALQDVLVCLGQVGVSRAVFQIRRKIPERAGLGRVDDVRIQRAGSGQHHRHIVLVHQGQAELVLVGVVGLEPPLDIDAGVIGIRLDHLVGVLVLELGAVEGRHHKGDGGRTGGGGFRRVGARSGRRAAGARTAAAGEQRQSHRGAHRECELLFHVLPPVILISHAQSLCATTNWNGAISP